MINKQLFDRSVAALVKAYHRGDLNPHNCAACAVGNLVAEANNYTIVGHAYMNRYGETFCPSWRMEMMMALDHYNYHESTFLPHFRGEIETTGYTAQEIFDIEDAFMTGCRNPEGDRFPGLMTAVDTLIRIHQGNEVEKQEAKALFGIKQWI